MVRASCISCVKFAISHFQTTTFLLRACLTLVLNRTRIEAEGRTPAEVSGRVRLSRLSVAAGDCGGCGLAADPNLMAMGIESFFACSLLILHELQKSEESADRS